MSMEVEGSLVIAQVAQDDDAKSSIINVLANKKTREIQCFNFTKKNFNMCSPKKVFLFTFQNVYGS